MKETIARRRQLKPMPMHTYYYIKQRCPGIAATILQDLLRIEGFTEVDVAYGAGLSVETVRGLLFKRHQEIDVHDLMALLDFFSRLFHRQAK